MPSWEVVLEDSIDMAVHAILVPGGDLGRVLYFAGTNTHLYDVKTKTLVPNAPTGAPGYNAFCSGHALLSDGRVLVAGGTRESRDQYGEVSGCQATPDTTEHAHGGMTWGGERRCAIFSPLGGVWAPAGDMSLDPASNPHSGGRWYPTLTTLPGGHVLAVGGHPFLCEDYTVGGLRRHCNNTPERYDAQGDDWTLLAENPPAEDQLTALYGEDQAYYDYQRNHLLANGKLFFVSRTRDKCRLYDASQGRFVGAAIELPPEDTYQSGSFARYTAVLLPLLHQEFYRPRVLVANGLAPYRIDLEAGNPAQWVKAGERQWPNIADGPRRYFACPVLLPTGDVFFSGGTQTDGDDSQRQSGAVLQAEIYHPGINWNTGQYDPNSQGSWTTAEEASVVRHYHSTALLLPDGSVWTAGSNGPGDDSGNELRVEIYKPAYFDSQASRPTVSSPHVTVGYAYTFDLTTSQASSIDRVALIRCGSVTHAFNGDQRYASLPFSVHNANTLRVQVPFQPEVLPPGRYMVWAIRNVNGQDLPSKEAVAIRISLQKAYGTLDVSTYSQLEVKALGTPAHFDDAIYLVYEGFLPGEVSEPTVTLRRPDQSLVPGMQISVGSPLFEAGGAQLDVAQRIVFPCRVTFTSEQAFEEMPTGDDFQDVTLTAQMANFTSQETLVLSKKQNPRMSDGTPHWLSIDLRAFTTKPGEALTAGVSHPSGSTAPYDYLEQLLAEYNSLPANDSHPFNSLPMNQEDNRLPIYSENEDGEPLYNYGIARVRFRAPEGFDAVDVRVFFRLWTTGWTALEFHENGSYRRFGNGPGATPLLGLSGPEINNMPCFAAPRVENMEAQTDPRNRRTIEGAGAPEVHAYFGCWLDTNQPTKLFPLVPNGNGPYDDGEKLSFQELIRGLHQCLIAEIHYTLDPIADGATPTSSDNLAQRNLLLDDSDNPGSFGSHVVGHTFEIKPSPFKLPPVNALQSLAAAARRHPDELVIEWGNLPRDSQATLYIPSVDASDVLRYAAGRQGPRHLRAAGVGTLQCQVADMSFVPIPGPFATAIPALLTVQLPPSVTSGQRFTIRLRQVDGRRRRVLAVTQFEIIVKTASQIVPRAKRNLAVLKHILAAIPAGNRWRPVFERYVGLHAERLRALGENPDAIAPDPTGGGSTRPRPAPPSDAVTGTVRELVYDCHGHFEGFVLDDCERRVVIASCDRAIEELLRRACHDRQKVTAHIDWRARNRLLRLVVRCC